MVVSILAAAGAAVGKAAATVGQAAVATAKVGAEAGAIAGKAGGQVAATTAQATGKTAATLGEGAANTTQTVLSPKAMQGGNSSLLQQDVLDVKTGKVLPDNVLKTPAISPESDLAQTISKLKNLYCHELEQLLPCKDTFNANSILNETFHRLSPEETMFKRLEFDKMKQDLIREWETVNQRSWPRYDCDVYSEAGNLIRPKGGLFDAHHAHPLGMGGENTVSNITPMNAVNHYDKQGIHAAGGAYDQLFKLLEA